MTFEAFSSSSFPVFPFGHFLIHPSSHTQFWKATHSTLILGLCKMCRVGNRERLNFWRKVRVPYISQRLTSFSDAPLYVNSPDRRSENYLTSDLIQRDGRSIQSIAIDISMPMPMQGSKWKCQACKLEVKELENFFGKVIGRRKENNWDYLYTIAACWL